MQMKPIGSPEKTQSLIHEYLQNHTYVTVSELCRTIKRTPADIRYHLNQLSAQGLVEMMPRGTGTQKQRGRPKLLYRARIGPEDKNITALCKALLMIVFDNRSPENDDKKYKELAEFLLHKNRKDGSLSQAIQYTIALLNQNSYQARWEATATGPRFIFSHCPFEQIIEQHPELCRLDRSMLEYLIRRPVSQITKISRLSNGPRFCSFQVIPEGG